MPSLLTNNSFTTATLLNGVTSAPRSLVDNQLSRSSDPAKDDSSDFYKFNLNGVSNLKVNLTEVSGDVKLSIYQSLTGKVPTDVDTPLNIRSSNTGRISDSYTSTSDPALADLPAGTYYIKVELGTAAPIGKYNLLVTGSSKQTTNSILWRDSSGSLKSWQLDSGVIIANSTFDSTTLLKVPASLQIVSTGDFDGDGVSDILWRDTATSTMRIWLMANGTQVKDGGDLTIQDSTGQAISRQSQWIVGATGDIDGDGSTDIVWRNTDSGEVVLWFMNGNRVSKETNLLQPGVSVGVDWKIVGFSNADNQRGNDLLWRNSNTNQLAIWTLSRNGLEAGTRVLNEIVPQEWQVIAYKDFNRDGIADLLWQNKSTSQVALWKMANGSTIADSKIYNGVTADYQLIGTEGMNGDGRPNPLWWNIRTGGMDVWTIADDGVSVTGKEVIVDGQTTRLSLTNLTGEWTPEAVQDFNGDGKADILWRNSNTNKLFSWRMDGNIVREGPEVKDVALPNQTTPPPATTLTDNFVTTGLSYGAYRTTNAIQVKSINVPQVTAGTSRLSAFNIGVLEGKGSFNDFVGGAGNINKFDWYTFTVETPSFLTALVSNSTAPGTSNPVLKAEVYSADGTDPNTPIANVTGIDSVLAKGTYFIRVSHADPSASNVPTPYTLTFTGKVGITNLNAVGSVTDGFGLKLSKSSIALDALEANNPIDITSFKFVNDGDFAANNVEVGFYVSKNGTFDTSDKLITLSSTTPGQTIASNLLTIGSVARGVTVTLSGLKLSLPGKNDAFWDASANYSIIAVIDPRNSLAAEKKKDDNTQAATLATIGVGNADLLGTAFTVAGNIKPSATISGTFAINNKGSRSTGVNGQSVTVKFYISNNLSIGSSDYLAQTVVIPATEAINPGTTRTGTYSFTLPTLSPITSTTPTSWDFYWSSLTVNKTTSFPAYVGMVIEFTDDADSSNNSNQGLTKDEATATVVLT